MSEASKYPSGGAGGGAPPPDIGRKGWPVRDSISRGRLPFDIATAFRVKPYEPPRLSIDFKPALKYIVDLSAVAYRQALRLPNRVSTKLSVAYHMLSKLSIRRKKK